MTATNMCYNFVGFRYRPPLDIVMNFDFEHCHSVQLRIAVGQENSTNHGIKSLPI